MKKYNTDKTTTVFLAATLVLGGMALVFLPIAQDALAQRGGQTGPPPGGGGGGAPPGGGGGGAPPGGGGGQSGQAPTTTVCVGQGANAVTLELTQQEINELERAGVPVTEGPCPT